MATIAGHNELVTTRTFEASRASVYRAWTEPDILAKWWGPHGFTNTFHKFDPREGGIWEFTMHGPNGADYANKNVYVEVSPERIVIDHVLRPVFRVTATFEERDGKTTVAYRQQFEHENEFKAVKAMASDGNEQLFDRLGEQLAAMSV